MYNQTIAEESQGTVVVRRVSLRLTTLSDIGLTRTSDVIYVGSLTYDTATTDGLNYS